jgi:hypothetical protein
LVRDDDLLGTDERIYTHALYAKGGKPGMGAKGGMGRVRGGMADSRECWHCGQKGHVKHNCPQLKHKSNVMMDIAL